jgi:hypothetical protein
VREKEARRTRADDPYLGVHRARTYYAAHPDACGGN